MRIKRKWLAGIGVLALIGAALWMRELASWRPHWVASSKSASTLDISPDGRFLRAGFRSIYDLERGEWAPSVPASESFYSYAPDQTYFSAQYYFPLPDSSNQNFPSGAKILRRELATGKVVWRAIDHHFNHNDIIRDIRLSGNGKQVLLWVGVGVKAFDTRGRTLVWSRASSPFDKAKFVRNVAINERFVWAVDDPEEFLSDVTTGRVLWRHAASGWNDDNGISPDNDLVWVTSMYNHFAHFYDVKNGKLRWKHLVGWLQGRDGVPLTFSSDGRIVAILNRTGAEWFEAKSGKRLGSRDGLGQNRVFAMALSRDGDWLYTLDKLSRIYRWRLR